MAVSADPELYCNAIIKVSFSDSNLQASCSGIFLNFADTTKPGLLLTTSSIVADLPDQAEIQVTCPFLIGDNTIQWYDASVHAEIPLATVNNFLAAFQHFTLQPESEIRHPGPAFLTILRSKLSYQIPARVWKDIKLSTVSSEICGSTLQVISCPYGLVNSALFSNFVSSGTISHVTGSLILADIRFLDGMDGGVAFVGDTFLSVGLVCGGLAKKSNVDDGGANGILLIVPWVSVKMALANHIQSTSGSIVSGTLFGNIKTPSVSSGPSPPVVYLVVNSGSQNQSSWGSGVIVAPGIIATNAHVVDGGRTIVAHCNNQNTPATFLSEPIKGFDLAFLSFDEHRLDASPVEFYDETPVQGLPVYSMGFGLFYPKTLSTKAVDQIESPTTLPLVSKGVVNAIFWTVFPDSKRRPTMVICSSKCWNGSSGGAVLDTKTNKLVGIMNSNGRHMASGKQIPELAFVIPSDVIEHALRLALEDQSVELHSVAKTLWQLRPTHQEILHS